MFFNALQNRSLVDISGEDAEGFLENILTCKIVGMKPTEANFGALLAPQGKILFDFFVIRTTEGFLFDLSSDLTADFIKRMMFYKLRAKVEIAKNDSFSVYASWDVKKPESTGIVISDPRLTDMGWRIYSANQPNGKEADYLAHRITQGMPEGGADFEYGDAYPHETLMDQFGGVDFQKGCYVGQEVVSRMQHRGTAKKRIIKVAADIDLPVSGTPITADGKPAGTLGSASGISGLALVRLDRLSKAETIKAGDVDIKPLLQDWVNFTWPENA